MVERTSRLVLLARMEGATAEAALAGFTCILNRVHMPMRKTLTYDQGKEMSRGSEYSIRTLQNADEKHGASTDFFNHSIVALGI